MGRVLRENTKRGSRVYMKDTHCPICGTEMQFLKIRKPELTLEGLPDNENRLMEVVEFWDSGYGLTPMNLRFYRCEECCGKKGVKHCDFVLFRNGEIYGFEGDKWVKIIIKERIDFT
jgi:hypothetical protein